MKSKSNGCLVLSRHVGERIAIDVNGTRIWITLTSISSRHRGAIGIQAPEEVVILREELLRDGA